MIFNGNVTSYTDKNVLLFYLPIVMALLTIILGITIHFDPFDKKSQNKNPILVKLTIFITPIVSNIIFLAIYINSKKNFSLNTKIPIIFIGLIFLIIGNYMPKNKQNAIIGVRNMWTLKDEIIWNKTNKLAGYLSVLIGILFIIIPFINIPPSVLPNLVLFFVFALSIGINLYSFILYYKKEKH
ncbi:SdpI family protein [Peptoanaerobacter stomatis]|uniref:SdpI family protein n=1 Tax=Peptoanaerobacter stomatis TaxID=796937 RepID=UPI001FA7EB59|nr:SdpI family protein [Peptoanaerobacter stomatis]